MVCMQEEYIKEEQRNLKRELLRAQEEVKRIQSVPLVIGQFLEMVDNNNGIVGSTTGSNYYVRYVDIHLHAGSSCKAFVSYTCTRETWTDDALLFHSSKKCSTFLQVSACACTCLSWLQEQENCHAHILAHLLPQL